MIQDLWIQYRKTPSKEIRNQILLHYIPYVESIAKQVEKAVPLAYEELKSAGIQALFSLIDQYNPDSGIPFEGFAYLRIRGSMIDEARNLNPIDRRKHDLYRKAQSAYSSVSRHVSLEELSETSLKKYDWFVDHRVQSVEEYLVKSETTFELQQALNTLSEQERLILSLYFVEEKRFNEIASILDYSPSYIAKIYHGCIQKLRFYLSKKRTKEDKR